MSSRYVLDSSSDISASSIPSSNPFVTDVSKEITIQRKAVAPPIQDEFFQVLAAVIAAFSLLFL